MSRKLASIQQVKTLEPIEGADRIEKATFDGLGWQVVVAKGMKVGDMVVYFELDSLLPELPEFEFMRPHHFRVKTMRLRKCLSQGLAIPVREVSGLWTERLDTTNCNKEQTIMLEAGQDVTDLLGISKYEAPIPTCLAGKVKGARPHFVPRTTEVRLQSFPSLIREMLGKEVYITTKIDGTSMSVYYNPQINDSFGVCSHKMDILETERDSYWRVANKHDLRKRLESTLLKHNDASIVIQGELCGPGIQKNRLNLKELDFFVFNVYYPDTGNYLDMDEMYTVCNILGLQMVPVEDIKQFHFTIEELLERAKGYYEGTKNRKEGIVVRTVKAEFSNIIGGSRLQSFKVINNDFLLKDED